MVYSGRTSSSSADDPAQELAWSLVLQHVLKQYGLEQQHVICKLLCCSNAISRLVHSTAAGQLCVTIPRLPCHIWADKPDAVRAELYGKFSRWLSRNAALLKRLSFRFGQNPSPSEEQALAAALTAGAATYGSSRAGSDHANQPGMSATATRAEAAAAASGAARTALLNEKQQQQGLTQASATGTAAEAAAAAAAAAAVGAARKETEQQQQQQQHQQQGVQRQQGLPLQEVLIDRRSRFQGSLLPGLADACPNLLYLAFVAARAPLDVDAVSALGRLTSLQELSWGQYMGGGSQGGFGLIAPAVARLTGLTQLTLDNLVLRASAVQHLPTSLFQLNTQWSERYPLQMTNYHPLVITHLTGLQHLSHDGCLTSSIQFPSSLVSLSVGRYFDHAALLPLQQVRALTVWCHFNMPHAEHFTELTQLQALQLCSYCNPYLNPTEGRIDWDQVLLRVHVPTSVHDLSLRCDFRCESISVSACEALEAMTQLRRLRMEGARLTTSPARLGQAFQRLPELTNLRLGINGYEAACWDEANERPTAPEMRPLVEALAAMPALRWLNATDMPLSVAAVSALAAATQLTGLSLSRCNLTVDNISTLQNGLTGLGPEGMLCYRGQSQHRLSGGTYASDLE